MLTQLAETNADLTGFRRDLRKKPCRLVWLQRQPLSEHRIRLPPVLLRHDGGK